MAWGEIPDREVQMMLRWIGLSKPGKMRNGTFNEKQSNTVCLFFCEGVA